MAKWVTMVEGRSSSVRSDDENRSAKDTSPQTMDSMHTFLHSNLGGAGLRLPLCRCLLILLHAPNLIRGVGHLEGLTHKPWHSL